MRVFFEKPPSNFNYKVQKLQCKKFLKMVTGNKSTNSNLVKHIKTYHMELWTAALSEEPISLSGMAGMVQTRMEGPYSHNQEFPELSRMARWYMWYLCPFLTCFFCTYISLFIYFSVGRRLITDTRSKVE